MNLIVLDTETSDLDPEKGAKLLEIAWIELSHTGQHWERTNSNEFYIEQPASIVISPHAQAAHHIRADMLRAENGAIPRYEAIRTLLNQIEPSTILVAHNAEFDSKFLPEIHGSPWICTFRSAKHIWPGAPGYGNQVLRYFLKLEPELPNGKHPHQALYDVSVTVSILMKMLETCTPEKLLMLSKLPVRMKTINFGKHRGQDFNQLPLDYVAWLRRQPNLDADLIHTLDSIIKR
jgi:exodeoxyribonuclease X